MIQYATNPIDFVEAIKLANHGDKIVINEDGDYYDFEEASQDCGR